MKNSAEPPCGQRFLAQPKSCVAAASTVFQQPAKSRQNGFTLIEVVLAVVLFIGVAFAIRQLTYTSQRFNTEATAMAQQNVYSTLRAQIALQGLNPTAVTNLAAPALMQSSTSSTNPPVDGNNPNQDQRNMGFVSNVAASFEADAVKTAPGADRTQAGSTRRVAVNYVTPALSQQTSKGIGFGYSLNSSGVLGVATTIQQLQAPQINFPSDLTGVTFPMNDIVSYPNPANPPGTTYRWTSDGSEPTTSSSVWTSNNPGWTVASFPHWLKIKAFNTDSQYSPSPTASTTFTYTYNVQLSFSRPNGRGTSFTWDDTQDPSTGGLLLTALANGSQVNGVTIYFTTDGSTPTSNSPAFPSTPYSPPPSAFAPDVTVKAMVEAPVSSDPRYIYSTPAMATYQLSPLAVPLTDPVITTDNSQALPPGTPIGFDFGQDSPFAYPITQNGNEYNVGNYNITLYYN